MENGASSKKDLAANSRIKTCCEIAATKMEGALIYAVQKACALLTIPWIKIIRLIANKAAHC